MSIPRIRIIPQNLYGRFLAIQIPIFLIVLALGAEIFASLRLREGRELFGARVGALAARVGSLLPDADPAADLNGANRLLAMLLADRGVACVEVEASNLPPRALSAPRGVGCKGQTPREWLTLDLDGGARMRVGLDLGELDQLAADTRMLALILGAAGTLLSGAAAAFAYRRTVGAPLARLVGVLRESARLGRHMRLDYARRDEIGVVAAALNTMQDRLERERAEVSRARDELHLLYNATPCLAFTMDAEGRVLTVSDYCLEAIGLRREDVLGARALAFVPCRDDRRRLFDAFSGMDRDHGVRDVPLRLARRDGRGIDLLLNAVLEGEDEGKPHILAVMADVTALREAEGRLHRLAMTDTLTGLANRAAFTDALRERANNRQTCVFLIDLDRFKQVNDVFGHEAGDVLLREAARRIAEVGGRQSLAARLGGDEFAILSASLNAREAAALRDSLRAAFARPIDIGDGRVADVGASIGFAVLDEDDADGAAMLRKADVAMYADKRAGRPDLNAAA